MAALSIVRLNAVRIGCKQSPALFGATIIHKRDGSNLAAYKRGAGGRSSYSGTVATVFGASGYLGRYVASKLGRNGSQIIIPYDCEPYNIFKMKVYGDLGQVLFVPFELRDDETIRKAVRYSNVVINCIGKDFETKNFKLDEVNVEGPRRIARITREMGIKKLIHVSALNASNSPKSFYKPGGSEFLRSKARGEAAVREEFPGAIILRPSDMFGGADRFIKYYVNYWRRFGGHRMPLYKKGEQTIKQPVYVSDVAQGIINAINDADAIGKTYDAVGPKRYYLSDLVDFFYRAMRHQSIKRTNLSPLFRIQAKLLGLAPNTPITHPEKLEREFLNDETSDLPTLEDLGVKLTEIEQRAIFELKPYRVNAYYEETLNEFAEPQFPPVVT